MAVGRGLRIAMLVALVATSQATATSEHLFVVSQPMLETDSGEMIVGASGPTSP